MFTSKCDWVEARNFTMSVTCQEGAKELRHRQTIGWALLRHDTVVQHNCVTRTNLRRDFWPEDRCGRWVRDGQDVEVQRHCELDARVQAPILKRLVQVLESRDDEIVICASIICEEGLVSNRDVPASVRPRSNPIQALLFRMP